MGSRLPIISVRGYAGTQGDVEETVDDPFARLLRACEEITYNAETAEPAEKML